MKRELEIVVPDLLDELDRALTAADPAARDLARVLGRADHLPGGYRGYFATALALCGIDYRADDSLPPAAVTAMFDLGRAGSEGILRADPVYLRADMSRLTLFDADTVGLEFGEADALLAVLNDAFGSSGLRFSRGRTAARWYLEGAPAVQTATYSPVDLRGRPLEPTLAAMRGMGTLKRVMTEAQMLFHDCTVNDTRAAAGKPPINSVWIWGTGTLPAATTPRVQHIITDDGLAAACAAHTGMSCSNEVGELTRRLRGGDGNLAVLCAPRSPGTAIGRFFNEMLRPAQRALADKHIDRFTLTTDAGRFAVTRGSRWRVWRNERAVVADYRARRARETQT